jgi:translocation and assembly module TamA
MLSASAKDSAYRVKVVGEDLSRRTRKELLALSSVQRWSTVGEVSARLLRARAEADLRDMGRHLEAAGHYAWSIQLEVPSDDALARPESAEVRFQVEAGPLFRVRSLITLPVPPAGKPAPPATVDPHGLAATADRLSAAGRARVNRLRENGHPWARLLDTEVQVDRTAGVVDVVFRLEPGPRATFGEITLAGLEAVREDRARRLLSAQTGRTYDQRVANASRHALEASDLFSLVRWREAEEPDAQGRVPVRVELRERRFRTLTLSLDYETDDGPGARAGLLHRNLFGGGERIATLLDGDENGLRWENRYTQPAFLQPRLALRASLDAERRDTDAYRADSLRATLALSHPLPHRWTGTVGTEWAGDDVHHDEDDRWSVLWSLPSSLERTTTDHAQDPARGHRLRLEAEPFTSLRGADDFFTRIGVTHRQFLPLHPARRVVLAGRFSATGILEAGRENIPAPERLYSGGGGSVRGYALQAVGPRDAKGKPQGGLSRLETSVELRAPLLGALGAVAFWDAGAVGETSWPGEGQALRTAVGGGLRLATPVGPIRFDLAFPLGRRPGDDPYQFYLSVGQAF